jgi:ATP-dependent 26S proteasome regulatory subunit
LNTSSDAQEINLQTDLSEPQLQAYLRRLDLLLHPLIWHSQQENLATETALRGLYLSEKDVEPFINSFEVALPSQEHARLNAELEAVENEIIYLTQQAAQAGYRTRLDHLTQAFNLNSFERDTLLICLAPSLSLHYGRLYAYLQDDVTRKYPNVDLVLRLLCRNLPERYAKQRLFSKDHILFHYNLISFYQDPNFPNHSPLNQGLKIDAGIANWLLGQYTPPQALRPHVQLNWLDELDEMAMLNPNYLPAVPSLGELHSQTLLVFYGPDRFRQRAAALQLAAQNQRPLLEVDLKSLVAEGHQPDAVLRWVLRDAHLTTAIPYLTGWESCLDKDIVPPSRYQELSRYPDIIILASEKRWRTSGLERQRPTYWFEFEPPNFQQREAIWRHFLGHTANRVNHILPDLAGQFVLTAGQVRDAVNSARNEAVQQKQALNGQHLYAAARNHSSPQLSHLARKITPRYTWQDLVLPAEQVEILQEIVMMVRGRPKVIETWGVGKKLASSRAVTTLFAGPPGTGKTMAAEVLANELQFDLYKINLSSVVSKYIGETEKNLEQIFTEAQNSSVILFFDEADSIFGKRSEVKDARDRYANIEVSYLLQRMESYDGITILATNLRANLDEAFTRRMQAIVDVPIPDEADRLTIWETLFPPDVPRSPNLDLAFMAQRFKLAGGSIRNIIVHATYMAAANGGQVTMEHLLHGTKRELQKMGRLIGNLDYPRS